MKINHNIVIMALIILAVSYLLITYPLLHIEEDVLEIFFGIFSIIYTIVAGFIILVLLENYNSINAHIWAEINELQDLRDYLVYVDNQEHVVNEIKATLKIYVKSVFEQEWPKMIGADKVDVDTSPEIYAIMKSINKIRVTNLSDTVALSKLIDTMGNVTTHRTNRLYSSSEELPFLLKLFIVISSTLVVFIFTLLPIQDVVIRFLLNGVNIFAIVFIYTIIWDLSHPFRGTWSINDGPYRDLATRL